MRTPRSFLLAAAVSAALTFPTRADDLLPPDRPVEAAVDHYVDTLLKADGVQPASPADDATLVRRLTLDLVGRIPTGAEADEYAKSSEKGKRAKLVDRLIASPGFVRHQAAQFDVMLNTSGGGSDGRKGSIREFLQTALKDGKTWDKIFREVMLPDEADPKKGAGEFLRSRVADLDRLTNDVSVAFFGVNVSCAQCHDHPLVADWKQDHFFGMKAFLGRTFDAGGFLAERNAGLVKFKPTKGPEKAAKLMFLTGATVETDTLREPTRDEQKGEKEATEKAKSAKKAPPSPAFSGRAKLVELALQPGQSEYFAKAIANRLWHRFLGYGLVNPLDQMHSENPPSHPELLAWLARDVSAHGYDLRRLVRGIVLSDTYARSSRYPSETPPQPQYFAVARLKPLTPMQLATSMKLAAADPAEFERVKSADELEKKVEGVEGAARGFASSLVQPADDFQVGVGEALLFTNGDRVAREYLADGGGTLLGRVKDAKDPKAAVALLVKAAYNRPPTDEEVAALTEYVRKRNDRPAEAYRQVLWALLTSAEFRFCY